jgi:hypothetical protein
VVNHFTTKNIPALVHLRTLKSTYKQIRCESWHELNAKDNLSRIGINHNWLFKVFQRNLKHDLQTNTKIEIKLKESFNSAISRQVFTNKRMSYDKSTLAYRKKVSFSLSPPSPTSLYLLGFYNLCTLYVIISL